VPEIGHDRLTPAAFQEAAWPLLQLVLDLVQASAGAGVVEITARGPGCADRSDHLVADHDDDAPPSNNRCGNLNRFANTGTVFDLSTSAVVSVLNDADV
jgi:hypothetical protein